MLGGAGILLGVAAVPAQAAEVSYKTECIPPSISGLPPVEGTTQVEITAPAEAKVGDEVTITWKFVKAASKNPDVIDLEKDTVKPTGTLKAGGAQTADIAMEGPRSNPAIPKNSAMKLSDMTGKLKLTAAGDVTLTPDAYNINVSKPVSTDTKCSPKETVKSAATIKVTGSGGSSGGTTGGLPTVTPTLPTGLPTSLPTGLPTGLPTLPTGSASPSASASETGGTGGSDTGGSTGGDSGGQTDFTGKEVSIPYACKTPIGDKNATSPVQINAAKNGGSFDLTVQFKKSVMDSPADIPADSVKPSMEVVLGGSDKGTVHVEGPTNAKEIKSGDPIEIPDLTGTYKPGASGSSTLSPGVLTVKALGTTTTCTPTKTEVSLTLDTTQQASGASGGDSSGTSSSGGLAETGSDSHGSLKALGLVAGTVILLGGAVFTFMPHRRLR
jgi:hypothetical protein